MRKEYFFKLLFILTCITALGLFLFSFTQVDLSLTLSEQTIFQTIQKGFQQLGFYQRPLATVIYVVLLGLLTIIYSLGIWASRKNFISEKKVWWIIGVFGGVLFFSYPAAFSYDIFNYIFTAKTVLIYHQNPYIIKPLDLQGVDPMLSFMRWTHLPSAYTPLWIGLTLVPYLLSFGSLLLSLWTMKIVPIGFYILSVFFIKKILEKTHPKLTTFGMVAFAFNPLVIIEVLISAHNDIVMMGFALVAFYLFLRKDRVSSFLFFGLSVAAKFITIFLIPLYLLKWSARKAVILLIGALLLVLFRREFLPWYMLWIVPFAVLLPERKELPALIMGVSLGLLLRYAPVFYFGDYNPPVPMLQNYLLAGSILVSIGVALIQRFLL